MNAILTATTGNLGTAEIEPFFYSLRLSGYKDDIIVFAINVSDDCRALLKRYGATVFEPEHHGLPMTYASLAKRICLAPKAIYHAYWKYHKDSSCLIINCWRFFGFKNYLASLKVKPDFILLADVRDVLFQSNPFSGPLMPGISVASECVRSTIGHSRGNSKWLWEAAGFRQMRKLADFTPVCSGTTLADGGKMMDYLEMMTEHLNRSFFWGMFDAIDQGLHNYFVHNHMITPLRVFTNWNGPFLTLDSEIVLPKNKNSEGYLCNRDGSIIPIIHQYDRIKELYKPGETKPPCWSFYH